MSVDTEVALAREVLKEARADPALFPRLLRRYLAVREAQNALTKERDDLRKRLLPLLDHAGGAQTINHKRRPHELYIDEVERWDYDPDLLHELVEIGLLTDEQFAAGVRRVVVKAAVEGWVKAGKVTESAIAKTGAQRVLKVVREIKVRPVGRPSGRKVK